MPKPIEDEIARISDIFLTNSYDNETFASAPEKKIVRSEERVPKKKSVRSEECARKKSMRGVECVRKEERAKCGVRAK